MSPVSMGKRTSTEVPLALVSPNEPVHGTRSKSRGTSISGPYEGKENTPMRSVRRAVGNAADEQQLETSRSSSARLQMFTSQKRTRSSTITDHSPRSRLRGGDKRLRGEDGVAGSQTSAPVRAGKGKDFFLEDKKVGKKLQITANADACSPSDDSIQSGALVCTAVQHNPEFSSCPEEQRLVACCSREQNIVSGELAELMVSKALVVPAGQSSREECGRKLNAGKKEAATKTYTRRKSSRGGITPSAPNHQEVPGTSNNSEKRPSTDEEDGIKSTEFLKSDVLLATVAGATEQLLSAYNKLYERYKNLKTKRLADAQEAFDEQSKRIEAFSRAADGLVENLRTTNTAWEQQEEMISRSRLLEAGYIECQNELVMERARNLELQQHLKNAELHRSKLLHEFVENTTQLTISHHGKSEIMFSDNQSGFEFKLEHNELSEEVGGKDALLYNIVMPGTISHVAPDWMQSEIVFNKAQLHVFFQRIQAVCRGVSV